MEPELKAKVLYSKPMSLTTEPLQWLSPVPALTFQVSGGSTGTGNLFLPHLEVSADAMRSLRHKDESPFVRRGCSADKGYGSF